MGFKDLLVWIVAASLAVVASSSILFLIVQPMRNLSDTIGENVLGMM